MNEHFVNVKVDREERPDVDALYMEAVQSMTGQGFSVPVQCKVDGFEKNGLAEAGKNFDTYHTRQFTFALDAEHDLNKKFDFDSKAFLAQVAQKLGNPKPIPEILQACVGGALDVLRPEAG